jgi:flagellar motor switch protein FliN
MGPQAASRVETYRQAWSESLALLLSRMAAGEWRTETEAVPAEFSAIACVRVTAAGGLAGGQCFSFAAADVAALLGIFLGEDVALGGELDATQNEALEELMRQWAGLAASALKPDFGEVTFHVTLEAPAEAPAGEASLLRATDGTRSIVLAVELDNALVAALKPSAQDEPSFAPQPNSASSSDASSKAEAESKPESPAQSLPPPASPPAAPRVHVEELLRQGNLELLMDVELAVMLRFGSRQATLREVLDLSTGAVLELDRELQEPVDLMLNGRVIARGEVVVVDGNYGLRVMEVASPQQRVNSL